MKKRPALNTICISAASLAAAASAASSQVGCFARDYSAAELAAQPGQVVESLRLHFTADAARAGTAYVEITAQMARQGHALRRGAGGTTLEEFGLCDADGHCTIACDGGTFRVTATGDDTLQIETSDARVSAQPCTPGTVVSTLAQVPGQVSVFQLTRAPDSACGR